MLPTAEFRLTHQMLHIPTQGTDPTLATYHKFATYPPEGQALSLTTVFYYIFRIRDRPLPHSCLKPEVSQV